MGLFDFWKSSSPAVDATQDAVTHSENPGAGGSIDKFVGLLLSAGIDGKGPFKSAEKVAEAALEKTHGDVNAAVDVVIKQHVVGAAVGGFVTSLGGFVTMPVALPINVLEYYLQAARCAGAIAHLKGHDIKDENIRAAAMLSLSGTSAEDLVARFGIPLAGGTLAQIARAGMPKSVMMLVNKGLTFRLLRSVGQRGLSRLGKFVPLVGGLIGGGVDAYLMHRHGQFVAREFESVAESVAAPSA